MDQKVETKTDGLHPSSRIYAPTVIYIMKLPTNYRLGEGDNVKVRIMLSSNNNIVNHDQHQQISLYIT